MLPSWADDDVVITPPTWVSDRGKQIATYDSGDAVTVSGCSVQPGPATEDLRLRDNVTIIYTAFLPAGTRVDRHSRVTFEGDDFAIGGVPLRWKSPTGAVDHVVLPLIMWEG